IGEHHGGISVGQLQKLTPHFALFYQLALLVVRMTEIGLRNSQNGIETCGLNTSGTVHYNLGAAELVEHALRRGEAKLTAHGALVAYTGQHTGRSPKDKFVVRDDSTDGEVWWDNNKAMSPENFQTLYEDFLAHAREMDLYVQDLV